MKKIFTLFLASVLCAALVSCSSPKEEPVENTENETQLQTEVQGPGEVEVITKEDGTKVAKSQTGLEVECTNENLMKLYEEYEKVSGSGSDEEKELLAKIQMIIEAQTK